MGGFSQKSFDDIVSENVRLKMELIERERELEEARGGICNAEALFEDFEEQTTLTKYLESWLAEWRKSPAVRAAKGEK